MDLSRDPNEAPLARKRSQPNRIEKRREDAVADFFDQTRQEAFACLHPQAKAMAPLVEKVMRELRRPELPLFNRIVQQWGQLTGAPLRTLARPLQLKGNCLEVSVSNPTVLYALCTPMLRQQLCDSLSRLTGGLVMAVKFTVSGK